MKKHLLRTLVLSCVLCLISFTSKAQWVSIPDSNFGTWLDTSGYDLCMQGNNTIGWQMDTTCPAIVNSAAVNCRNQNIYNLTGIQYFDNLDTLDCSNNPFLSGLSALPNSLTYLNCSYIYLGSLPALPNSLMYLLCRSSNLSYILTFPDSLTYLDCRSNQMNAIGQLPNSLTYLDCSSNVISYLSPLPNTLTNLNCVDNRLNSLPALPNLLLYLECGANRLSILPTLPDSLLSLGCGSNQLTSLPPLPNSLTDLGCGNNPLDSLPPLPNSLNNLDCYGSQLTSLPVLPNSLTKLQCGGNQLDSLPSLPNSLTWLDCRNNQLSSLPVLPAAMTYLDCSYNQFSSLPALPDSLNLLACYSNQLDSLPALPNSLTTLACLFNQLSSLPELPDSLNYLNCSYNPNLFCLPRLKKIVSFDFTSTGITCLPNYPQSNATYQGFPLCDVFNTHACSFYRNISGKAYVDSNANCLYNTGGSTFSNLKVQLYQNGVLQQLQNTYAGGSYSFVTDSGTYTFGIDTTNLFFAVACPDSGYYTSVISALDSIDADMDFGLRCKPGVFDLVAQSISAERFRPANITTVNITCGDATNFYGAHCVSGVSGSVQVIINGAAHYSSAAIGALTPTSVLNDTITWSIADFGAVDFFHDFNIHVATDTMAVLDSQICFTLIVNPIAGDNNPANNILTHCFTVVGSFDPNEKEVYPSGNTDTATKWLTYTIHFQNTGTAEAQHIYLTDTLDNSIDAGSFQLLAYSHQPMVQLKGNNLRFNFPNINLPDSNTNEPLSHGYVQFKVKLKDNLPIGTNINNTAFIYFDFNAPVVTNTTSNTISILTTAISSIRIPNSEIRIYPNPANESVTISVDASLIGSALTITDVTGREVMAVRVLNSAFSIPTSAFASGVYFVTVANEKGKVTRKLVKQ